VTPEQLVLAIRTALAAAVAAGELSVVLPDDVRVERPKNREHGDWSTNVSLQIAKGAGMPPREVATAIASRLVAVEGIKAVDVAGPGFLNITVEAASAGELARTIVEGGASYGRNDSEAGHVINLEFVSANPTGPLHIGHTRWAALGDSTRRLLAASGAAVTAEYYVNDAGAQMEQLRCFGACSRQGARRARGRLPGRVRHRDRHPRAGSAPGPARPP